MNGSSPRPGFLVTWCRLLRVPNLFTVPGDVLAGYLLASGGKLGWPVLGGAGAAVLIYCGGLLLNDYFDRGIDAQERPNRPLPSGAADPLIVLGAGIVMLFLGIGVAYGAGEEVPGLIAAGIAVAAFIYDAGAKRVRWLGPLVMGLCRAGSVLLGAALAGDLKAAPALVAVGVGANFAYITVVTFIALREASGLRIKDSAWWPPVLLIAAPIAMMVTGGLQLPTGLVALFLFAAGAIRVGMAAKAAQRAQIPIPAYVGVTIRSLLFMQAAWCIWRMPASMEFFGIIAGTFAVCFLGAELLSKWFYSS